MKITNITSSNDDEFTAEIKLSKKQLEFITNIGIGVLLQAGASSIMIDPEDNDDIIFNKKEEDTIEGSATTIPQPATE